MKQSLMSTVPRETETTITFTEDEVIDICFALSELIISEARKISENIPIGDETHSRSLELRYERIRDYANTFIITRDKLPERTAHSMVY